MRRAIIGLGNPGARYRGTRHNVGFVVVEAFAADRGVSLSTRSHGARWGCFSSDDVGEVFLAEPQSFMNRSGEPVAALLDSWGVPPTELLVVHDDVDLALGRLRLKQGGGMAGHRGLLSIEEGLGTRDFCRLRFGVGRPADGWDTADWVLAPFAEEERAAVEEAVGRAVSGLSDWLRLGLEAAMQRVNARPETGIESEDTGC